MSDKKFGAQFTSSSEKIFEKLGIKVIINVDKPTSAGTPGFSNRGASFQAKSSVTDIIQDRRRQLNIANARTMVLDGDSYRVLNVAETLLERTGYKFQ